VLWVCWHHLLLLCSAAACLVHCVLQVHCLLDIDTATAGEVQIPHLGEGFLTTLQQLEANRAATTTTTTTTPFVAPHLRPAAAAGTPHSHLEAPTIRPRR
jgi:hypothetical protein